MVILLLLANIAFASFSSFVVISPVNEQKYPFMIQVRPAESQKDHTYIRIIGPVDGYQKVWLIVCKRPLQPARQNFRSAIWEGMEQNTEIVSKTRLEPKKITLPETGGQQYVYVEATLSNEEMQRSYLYIDYPAAVDDGGFYYSIDLAYYLEGPSGKKSLIQWE